MPEHDVTPAGAGPVRVSRDELPIRLPLPVPYAVRVVNAYLLLGDPLTLVDSGTDWGETRSELEASLATHGVAIEDIEQLIITHQHHDHAGLAHYVKERSGAIVVAHHLLGPFLGELAWDSMEAEDLYQAEVMRLHGVPEERIRELYEVSKRARVYGGSVDVDRGIREGDVVEAAGRRLTVFERPGHSPSDLIFVEEDGRFVLGGDHLLGSISSNPIVHRPLAGPADPRHRVPALVNYVDSLRRTAELDVGPILPGHGPPIEGHRALVADRLAFHERRKERIFAAVAARARTAHEVALEIWDDVAIREAFLTLSEALGHLDLLEAEGRVTSVDQQDGLVVYQAREA
jgi:glyoxylase-like metal-dependent hydrolase (beta-lactamase superfamily II)